MKVSYNWLKELVNLNVTPKELVDKMSLHSIEVEEDYPMVNATNLVVGHVLSRVPHENSDHLSVCQVNLGDYTSQIVCGAPNVAAGQKVIVALPGAKLPGIEIKSSVIRGVESNGMICSLAELGIENKYIPEEFAHGIYVLGEDAKPGMNALEYLGYDDHIIELGLTPNRMDLLSMLGVAYDVNAIYRQGLKPYDAAFTEIDKSTSSVIDVEIATPDCFSYYARAVEDVVIKESPAFIKARLIASGIRPINNVVDITNYVLMMFGQPLHAFDREQLGTKITVRNAFEDEKTITLDNIERVLKENDIVITDNKVDGGRVVCLGGVMGCSNTEVRENTKNLILESAVFRPINIRRTSSRLGLRSESSVRFERGVDLNRSLMAVNYACHLLEKYADAKILKGYVHKGTEFVEDKTFEITEKYIENYLGVKIPLTEINDIFKGLSFTSEIKNEKVSVKVPNRRLDISIPEDLVEEVGRIYGYSHLNETVPLTNTIGGLTAEQRIRRKTKHLLCSMGLSEVITYSLVSPKEANEFKLLCPNDALDIKLLYPMSEERSVLRKSLIPTLASVMRYNNARKINDLAIFEIGKHFYMEDDTAKEALVLSGLINGTVSSTSWKGQNEKVDFYFVKGLVDELSKNLKVSIKYQLVTPDTLESTNTYLHPHRAALILIGDQVIGYLGELHPEYIKEHELNGGYVFEILFDELVKEVIRVNSEKEMRYQPISKVPSVERDLALLISKEQPLGEIITAIKNVDKKMITNVAIFDIFADEKIGLDKQSVAFRITLEADETLTEEIISSKITKILKMLEYRFKITLRA